MKCILVAATSTDGFITRDSENDARLWTSKEEQEWFADTLSKHSLQVFGSGTYDALKPPPREGVLKIVLTKNPERYQAAESPGLLEFVHLSPQKFIEKYQSAYETCLILGGSHVYSDFIEAGFVDELLIVVEPIVHRKGLPLFVNGKQLDDYNLTELAVTPLNAAGTKLYRYSVH